MDANARAAHLKLIAFDVDGVMTDGHLYFTPGGDEIKAFSTLDGHGLRMLMEAGIEVAIISGRRSQALTLRARDLGITALHMGIADKRTCLAEILKNKAIDSRHSGYMGDDVVDLPVLRSAGLSLAPANAHAFVQRHVHHVTAAAGGHGAVREACDFILRAQGRLDAMLARYLD